MALKVTHTYLRGILWAMGFEPALVLLRSKLHMCVEEGQPVPPKALARV